ncbi:MAG: ABC transporter permease subunit, partial [Comamonadaceae bacterium]
MEDYLSLMPALLRGLWVTIGITVGAALLAVPLALAAGLARMSRQPWVSWPAAVYVEVFRGTSALVQLFWFYFVLPLFGLQLPAIAVGVIVLAANAGAYGAEVVRGAVNGVLKGQREAAIALNMTSRQIMQRIV